MSRAGSTLMTNPTYYSAHRGPVWDSNGQFHHFTRQCDLIHTRNGYWRFCTYNDDRRAFERGLTTPEAVLIAQDVGDGVYDDIMLRWVSGELDQGNKPTVGTAAAHLENIYNERRVLGKSLSFRGRVPLYPISTDQRLINYRLMRYGIQKGVISEIGLAASSQSAASTARTSSPVLRAGPSPSRYAAPVFAPMATRHQVDGPPSSGSQMIHLKQTDSTHSAPQTIRSRPQSVSPRIDSPHVRATTFSTNQGVGTPTTYTPPQSRSQSPLLAQSPMGSRTASQASPPYLTDQYVAYCGDPSISSSPQAGTKPISPSRSIPTPEEPPLTTTQACPSPPDPRKQAILLRSIGSALLAQERKASPLDPRLYGRMRPRPNGTLAQNSVDNLLELSISTEGGPEELSRIEDDTTVLIMHGSDSITDEPNDALINLLCADLTSSQLYDAQSATLPCMSCEVIGAHASHCWIQEAKSCLKPTKELTETKYRELVANIERFDPGPWTTHVGSPPEVVPEDPDIQLQGMAEMIRSFSGTAENPDFEGLDDQFTILLWALKSSGNIQVIREVHLESDFGESDQDDSEIPDAW